MSSLLCQKGDFLSDVDAQPKSVEKRLRAIERADSGEDIPEFFRGHSDEPVVEFGEFQDGSFHHPGPNSDKYENTRERCGAPCTPLNR